MFVGRNLVIATMHQKEKVLAPLLEKALGVQCIVPKDFNTDQWGTFSGEIPRVNDPVSAARIKCLKAMELTGCSIGVASEGSFGPHPSMFFVQANDEILIFIDQELQLEIICRELSTATNFNGKTVTTESDLMTFADQVLFPSHGLILRSTKDVQEGIVKGITDPDSLIRAFHHLLSIHGSVFVETDMRAMYNPTRHQVIAACAQKLIERIQSSCPQCGQAGFGVTDYEKGLPCSWCGSPTQSILAYVSVCAYCGFSQKEVYPKNKTSEDPMFCDRCNP